MCDSKSEGTLRALQRPRRGGGGGVEGRTAVPVVRLQPAREVDERLRAVARTPRVRLEERGADAVDQRVWSESVCVSVARKWWDGHSRRRCGRRRGDGGGSLRVLVSGSSRDGDGVWRWLGGWRDCPGML